MFTVIHLLAKVKEKNAENWIYLIFNITPNLHELVPNLNKFVLIIY